MWISIILGAAMFGTMARTIVRLRDRYERCRGVVEDMARVDNWDWKPGNLRWQGMRDPIEYAQTTLDLIDDK